MKQKDTRQQNEYYVQCSHGEDDEPIWRTLYGKSAQDAIDKYRASWGELKVHKVTRVVFPGEMEAL